MAKIDPREDPVVRLLKKHNIPVTRENYIGLAYGDDHSGELGAEEEAQLPVQLQDPSKLGK